MDFSIIKNKWKVYNFNEYDIYENDYVICYGCTIQGCNKLDLFNDILESLSINASDSIE